MGKVILLLTCIAMSFAAGYLSSNLFPATIPVYPAPNAAVVDKDKALTNSLFRDFLTYLEDSVILFAGDQILSDQTWVVVLRNSLGEDLVICITDPRSAIGKEPALWVNYSSPRLDGSYFDDEFSFLAGRSAYTQEVLRILATRSLSEDVEKYDEWLPESRMRFVKDLREWITSGEQLSNLK